MWQKKIAAWWQDESAPTFFEYALLIIVIALAVLSSATVFGQFVWGLISSVTTNL